MSEELGLSQERSKTVQMDNYNKAGEGEEEGEEEGQPPRWIEHS